MATERNDARKPTTFACRQVGNLYVGHCDCCGESHAYGAGSAGLRARKCRFSLSPGQHESVVLDILREASLADTHPTPFAAAGRSLCPALEASADALRKAVVGAATGASRQTHWTRRRLADFTVDVFDFDARWWVDQGVLGRVEGRGPLSLLSILSGASVGALAVMILRLLGLDLPVADLRQIRAFIDLQLRDAEEDRGPSAAQRAGPAAGYGAATDEATDPMSPGKLRTQTSGFGGPRE